MVQKKPTKKNWSAAGRIARRAKFPLTSGKLAFVKADATLIVEGKALRHNFDYFTLIKENYKWV